MLIPRRTLTLWIVNFRIFFCFHRKFAGCGRFSLHGRGERGRMHGTQKHVMMRKISIYAVLMALFSSSLLVTCAQRYGSVAQESVEETLTSDVIAVTPCIPGFLLEPEQIHRLSSGEKRQLLTILRRGEMKVVHESHYRDAAPGKREDMVKGVFYLYGSNAQCLGGRVMEGKVLMDDIELSEEDSRELYRLLYPHLSKVVDLRP